MKATLVSISGLVNVDEYNSSLSLPEDTSDLIIAELKKRDLLLKRGYIVHLSDLYDDMRLIFTGKDFIELTHDYETYGTVPKEFRALEEGFPHDYWVDIIKDGADAVWITKSVITDGLVDSFKIGKVPEKDGEDCMRCTFKYKDNLYYIVADFYDAKKAKPEDCAMFDKWLEDCKEVVNLENTSGVLYSYKHGVFYMPRSYCVDLMKMLKIRK